MMYLDGDGVDQNTVMAHVWANFSAVNGDADSENLRDIVAEHLSASDINQPDHLQDGLHRRSGLPAQAVGSPISI